MTTDPDTFTIPLDSEAATQRLAARLARLVRRGDVLALWGGLGAGKTTLARAFIRTLCDDQDAEVPSPTFTLVQPYETENLEIFHFDLFRLERPDDAVELGIDDAFAEGISLIEWPEKLGHHLPKHRLDVELSFGRGKHQRTATLTGHDDWQERLRESGHA